MRRAITAVLMTLAVCARPALSADILGEEVGINLDLTYATRYVWHGMDLFPDDDGAFHPSVTLEYKGFSAGIWAALPDQTGHTDTAEADYFLGYGHTFFPDKRYALDAHLSYTYFDFVKSDSKPGRDGVADFQELAFEVSLPNAIAVGPSNLVPSYSASYVFAGKDTDNDELDNGWFHVFALAYDIPFTPLIKEQEAQTLSVSTDITYEDGPFGLEPGWTHSTIGLSTTFEYRNFYFTPAVYYQWTFEDDNINDEDEFYAMFSLKFRAVFALFLF